MEEVRDTWSAQPALPAGEIRIPLDWRRLRLLLMRG